MKRSILFLAVTFLCISLAACHNKGNDLPQPEESDTTSIITSADETESSLDGAGVPQSDIDFYDIVYIPFLHGAQNWDYDSVKSYLESTGYTVDADGTISEGETMSITVIGTAGEWGRFLFHDAMLFNVQIFSGDGSRAIGFDSNGKQGPPESMSHYIIQPDGEYFNAGWTELAGYFCGTPD